MERDVAEAQRGHHGERPVEAGKPGVVLSLAQHEEVECDRVDRDHRGNQDQEAGQAAELGAGARPERVSLEDFRDNLETMVDMA